MDKRASKHSGAGSRQSGRYGQSCLNCSKSKCKCILRPDGTCERCRRLNKQCYPPDSLRKRNSQKLQNSGERIEQLEERLNSLVSLLQSVVKSPLSTTALHHSLANEIEASKEDLQQQSALTELATPQSSSSIVTSRDGTNYTTEGAVENLPNSYLLDTENLFGASTIVPEISTNEAEAYLAVFRSQMLQYSAFIHLPSDLNAQQLRQDRPFLFRAIIAVVSPSTQQKLARGRELKRILAQITLLENQSSIDLLLGLLTYIAWSNDQFLNKNGTLSRLMLLAMSLVYDLRLNKPLPQDAHMIGQVGPDFGTCKEDSSAETDNDSLERQRAVLGCFLLSSIVSSYFAQIDAMRWTPRMEKCLRAVGNSDECPTDKAFAFQVRLQLIAQRAVHLREQQETDHANTVKLTASTYHPNSPYLKALHGQLQDLQRSLSPELQQHEILIAHMHYIELCINETCHSASSNAPLTPVPNDGGSSMPRFERLECLWHSVRSIKSWLAVFFALSPSACVGISFLFWAQLSRCLVVLYRLSTYIDPAWDCHAVRDMVDLLLVLDQTAEKLELVSSEAGEQSNDDLFMQLLGMIRMFRAWAYLRILPRTAEETAWDGTTANIMDSSMMDQNQMIMMQSIDLESDMWLEDMFGRS